MDWVLALTWFLPGMLVVLALSAIVELAAGATGFRVAPLRVRSVRHGRRVAALASDAAPRILAP